MLETLQSNADEPRTFRVLRSAADASVNWVRSVDEGQIEARFVRRSAEYIVVYLSSQTGCRQACRMCHLTATGQTRLRHVTQHELLEQADLVLDHYRTTPVARSVHFNFMARGEPLANPAITHGSAELFDGLWQRADEHQLAARFLVSTIMPRELGNRPLEDIFRRYHPEIYYSLYSTRETFRKRWLPQALPVAEALDRLVSWQRQTYKLIKVHYAFIEGENDSEADVHAVCDALEERHLAVHVNIVRYNPPSPKHGTEPPHAILERNAQIFRTRLPHARVKLIPRVGFDVKASCGVFMPR